MFSSRFSHDSDDFTKIQISKEIATRLSIYFREVTAAKHV